MKIAYDLHGVITACPDRYKEIMSDLYKEPGMFVWVVSGPRAKQVKEELDSLGFERGVHYHGIASVVDFLISKKNNHTIDENGNYWFDEITWWKAKADICRELGISILTDDHQEYGDHFSKDHPTKFILHKAPIG